MFHPRPLQVRFLRWEGGGRALLAGGGNCELEIKGRLHGKPMPSAPRVPAPLPDGCSENLPAEIGTYVPRGGSIYSVKRYRILNARTILELLGLRVVEFIQALAPSGHWRVDEVFHANRREKTTLVTFYCNT